MRKTYLLTLLMALCCAMGVKAQTVYSTPPTLQQTTQNVTIYFNAVGTPLEGQAATANLYAHTGVYVDNVKKWVNAPTWGTNTDKYKLVNEGTNLWSLYIGDIREYYEITNPAQTVTSLCFVFRTAGKDIQTADLFLPVYEDGFQIDLTSDATGNVIAGETGYVNFNVYVTEAADITLTVNNTTIGSATNAQSLQQSYTFTSPGEYTVKATATNSSSGTVSTEQIFNYIGTSPQVDYPGGTPKMGPVTNSDGSVTFCLGAQEKHHVVIMGSWNNYEYDASQVMNYQDTENGRYFWVTIPNLNPSTMYVYYFVIDGGQYYVADPCAQLILDKNNDNTNIRNRFATQGRPLPNFPTAQLNGLTNFASLYWGNISNYDWQVENFEIPDHNNLIIYELLFRDFTGTEGASSGNGTVALALEKIDYLKELGVNAIELLPIMEFNGNQSWGYNPNFYMAVDKYYGTPKDYKQFIDACHQNGMAVILDIVFNQCQDHPWYTMYPTNKNPYYNQVAPHAYSVLNDWNQGNPQLQEHFRDILQYWLTEYKVDGFRFDLVKGLGTNESYANSGDAATNAYNASRVAEMLSLQAAMQEVNPNAIFINENLAGATEEKEMSNTSYQLYSNMQINWANFNEAACQFAMGYKSGSALTGMYAPSTNSYPFGSRVSYLESHDEERMAYKQTKWGETGVKGNTAVSMQRLGSTAAQMLMLPGPHMIWQFQELGNDQTTKDSNNGNNTGNKKVNWALLDEPNHRGLYDNYCQLISIRMENPEMFNASTQVATKLTAVNWETGRSISLKNSGNELYTFINPNISGAPLVMSWTFDQNTNDAYQMLSWSYNSEPSFDAAAGTVTIPANCYVVIGSKSLTPAKVENIQRDEEPVNELWAHGGYGEVIVDHAANGATIYSLDGKIIGRVSESGRVKANSGMYIVRGAKKSVKVIVR